MADTRKPATMREHWQAAQKYLTTMLDQSAYDLWVRTLEPQGYANGVLVLAAQSAQQRDRVAARLDKVIRHALWMQTGKQLTVEYVLQEQLMMEYVLQDAQDGGVPC